MRWDVWKQLTPEEKEEYDFKFDYNVIVFPLSRIVSANLFRLAVFIFLFMIHLTLFQSHTPLTDEAIVSFTNITTPIFFYLPNIVLIILGIDILIIVFNLLQRIVWFRERIKVKHETVVERVEVTKE